MKAQDVMVRNVLTVGPDTLVADAVAMLVKHDISALPVANPDGSLIGILSEADLLEREELGAEHHYPWWIESLMPASKLAERFAKAHSSNNRGGLARARERSRSTGVFLTAKMRSAHAEHQRTGHGQPCALHSTTRLRRARSKPTSANRRSNARSARPAKRLISKSPRPICTCSA